MSMGVYEMQKWRLSWNLDDNDIQNKEIPIEDSQSAPKEDVVFGND